ncbi:MAG: hypothetical protein Tsb007_38620 [Rhizobacter sp.]
MANSVAEALLVKSTLATLLGELPLEEAPDPLPVPDVVRDSTGAGLSSSLTFEAQPARNAEDTAAMRARRDMFMGFLLSS